MASQITVILGGAQRNPGTQQLLLSTLLNATLSSTARLLAPRLGVAFGSYNEVAFGFGAEVDGI